MTGPAAQPPQPNGPTTTDCTFLYQSFRQPEAPDTWTADAAYPVHSLDSPVPYTLTAKAETLLGEAGSPTILLRKAHACGICTRPPQARSGLSGQPRTYITEISLPPTAEEISKLAGMYGGEMALQVVLVGYLRQLPESRALVLAMNRSPVTVKVRPVWRRASFRLRANPAAYVPPPEPVALPQIKPGAEGEAA